MVIIETKLHIPRIRHDIVARPLLMAKLDKGLDCKATLITAPPGYGKTTTVSEWTRTTTVPAAWVSLDEEDNHWLRFWMHLIAALKKAVAGFDEQAVYRFTSSEDAGESFIAALINRLNRMREPIAIVWDDFHYIEHASILDGMYYLLKRLPAHVHLYMISREQLKPSLPLSKLRMNGELNSIGVEDLRFKLGEAQRFFGNSVDGDLSVLEKKAILKRTEGWITGMRLAGIMFNDRKVHDSPRYSAYHSPRNVISDISGGQRDIADYFFEEVLGNQSELMQKFLLQTSILERLNNQLCAAVTGLANSVELLQELERKNLFIIPLDEHRKWYRYHHLFREYLSQQLDIREREQGRKDDLHSAAGKWLEEHNELQQAAVHYVAGRDYEEVLRLMAGMLPKLTDYERVTLHQWLNQLPDELLFEKPMLYLTNLASLFLSGHAEAAREKFWWAYERLEAASAHPPLSEAKMFRAGLLFLASFKTYLERDFAMSIHYSEQYKQCDPKGTLFVSLGTSSGGHHSNWEIHVMTSSLQTSEQVLKDLLQIWSETENAYFYAHLCIDYGKLLYEWNRLKEAEQYLLQTSEIGRAYGNVSLEVMAVLLLARVYTANGRLEVADALLQSLAEQVDEERYPKFAWKIEQFRVRQKWKQGEAESAKGWLAASELHEEDEIPSSMIEDYDFLACLLAEQQQSKEAVSLIERLLWMARRERRQSDTIRLLTHKSLLLARQGNDVQSLHVLEEALSIAEPAGFIRTFLDEGDPLLKLLSRYAAARQSQHLLQVRNVSLAYVKQLIGLFPIAQVADADGDQQTGAVWELTAKEMEVIQLLRKGLSNKEIAAALSVSLSTVKTHVNNIYRKLQVNNRMLAIQRATQLKLIT